MPFGFDQMAYKNGVSDEIPIRLTYGSCTKLQVPPEGVLQTMNQPADYDTCPAWLWAKGKTYSSYLLNKISSSDVLRSMGSHRLAPSMICSGLFVQGQVKRKSKMPINPSVSEQFNPVNSRYSNSNATALSCDGSYTILRTTAAMRALI